MGTLIELVESLILALAVTVLVLILVGVLIGIITPWLRPTRKTRTVQEIFDAVIDSGCYSETCKFMCPALSRARNFNVITTKEYNLAVKEIREYLGDIPCLVLVLGGYEIPVDFNTTKAVYENWNDRPAIYKHSKNVLSNPATIPNSQENPYAEKHTI